jgi:hypothetical protein
LLFNLYSKYVFKEALSGIDKGLKINGVVINNIRYADDTVLLAESVEDLQELLNLVDVSGKRLGLSINVAKTKWMSFGRLDHTGSMLHLNGHGVERVEKFKYLGSILTQNVDPDVEIKCRIEAARAAFNKMKTLFCNDSINLKLRQRMIKCYVWSVLLYGCETWTLKVGTMNRLEAFEMWLHRRMLKIPWTDMVTNTDVLRRARADRELLSKIKIRKVSYLGHVMRGEKYHLLQLILEGKICGRRGPGRRQLSWLRNIREWTGIRSVEELIRIAQDREAFARVIANVGGTQQGT